MEDSNKKVIDYIVPIQSEGQVEKYNKMCEDMYGENFTPLKSTEDHFMIVVDRLCEAFDEVSISGGSYLGDGVSIKIELEYEPEDK